MKKGNWNYTEGIEYRVVDIRLEANPDKPMYWQNAFAGETIQAVEITSKRNSESCAPYVFYISNQDGSGLLKIQRGGGPDSYSAHIDDHFEVLEEVPEEKWNEWDPHAHFLLGEVVEKWQEENHPEEFKKLQAAMAAWDRSPMNPKNIKR